MNAAELPTDDHAQLGMIRDLCNGEVSLRTDGWRHLLYMGGLKFTVAGQSYVMDAVLCLNHDNPSYPTKIYLAENVGANLNWNESAYLLGRHWHTFSWRDVQPNQPYIKILAAHLAPLARGGP